MVIDEMYCTIHYNWFVLLSTYHRQRKIDIKVKLILIGNILYLAILMNFIRITMYHIYKLQTEYNFTIYKHCNTTCVSFKVADVGFIKDHLSHQTMCICNGSVFAV